MPCRKQTAPISSYPQVAGGWGVSWATSQFSGVVGVLVLLLSALGLPSPAQGCWDLGQLSQTRAKPQGTEMGLFPSTLKLGRSCSLLLPSTPQLPRPEPSLSSSLAAPTLPCSAPSTLCVPLAPPPPGISVSPLLCCRALLQPQQPLSGGSPMASGKEGGEAWPRGVLVSDLHVLLLPNTNKTAKPAAQLCHT